MIIPWATAGGLAYWFFTETNGSKLKKKNASLYEQVKDDPSELEAQIKTAETQVEQSKKAVKTAKDAFDNAAEGTDKDTAKQGLEAAEKNLSEMEDTLSLYKGIGSGGMWMPVLSLSNILTSLGIFLVAGIILHWIFKKVIGMIWSEEKE